MTNAEALVITHKFCRGPLALVMGVEPAGFTESSRGSSSRDPRTVAQFCILHPEGCARMSSVRRCVKVSQLIFRDTNARPRRCG
jgi:hypothetical protein